MDVFTKGYTPKYMYILTYPLIIKRWHWKIHHVYVIFPVIGELQLPMFAGSVAPVVKIPKPPHWPCTTQGSQLGQLCPQRSRGAIIFLWSHTMRFFRSDQPSTRLCGSGSDVCKTRLQSLSIFPKCLPSNAFCLVLHLKHLSPLNYEEILRD